MGEELISPDYAYADGTGFDATSLNSSRPVVAPVKAVNFDKDASLYDMSGHKYMIIFNHYIFEDTRHFTMHPDQRTGTMEDELRLKQVFTKLGFLLFVRNDCNKEYIFNFLSAFADSDHTRTSCICVTILTHGDKGGQIFAADRPYYLKDVTDIFLQKSLTNKPKLFFVQACRGKYMDSGHEVYLKSHSVNVIESSGCDSTRVRPNYYSSSAPVYYNASQEKVSMIRKEAEPAAVPVFDSYLFKLYKYCRYFWYAANTAVVTPPQTQNSTILTVPTHADSLVLRSTVENYRSWRDEDGSWMIKVLCGIIEEHHKNLNLVDMIIKMNRTVAYDKISCHSPYWDMNNKKQIPETSITLTKHLKFETVLS